MSQRAHTATKTARYWGERETGQCRHANGTDEALKKHYSEWQGAIASCDDKHVHTSPVGTYRPNGFGLHDMSGNVWEWLEDCWHDGCQGATGVHGRAGGDCSGRVLRGGSWDARPRDLRSANRYRDTTGNRSDFLGFRIARTLTP